MGQSLKHRSITEFAAMSAEDIGALLAAARELHGAAASGMTHRVLRGKNLALLCSTSDAAGNSAATFQRAASELGAQVAQLRHLLNELSTPEQVTHTALMLGRLYDGIECIGMPAELVQRIGAAAGVPVFESISSADHPTSRLAIQLGSSLETGDERRTVLQAVLIASLA